MPRYHKRDGNYNEFEKQNFASATPHSDNGARRADGATPNTNDIEESIEILDEEETPRSNERTDLNNGDNELEPLNPREEEDGRPTKSCHSCKLLLVFVGICTMFVAGIILGVAFGTEKFEKSNGDVAKELEECRLEQSQKESMNFPGLLADLHNTYINSIHNQPLPQLNKYSGQQVYSASQWDRLLVKDIVEYFRKSQIYNRITIENYTVLGSLPDPEGSLLEVVNRTSKDVILQEWIGASRFGDKSKRSAAYKDGDYGSMSKQVNITQPVLPPFVAYSVAGKVKAELVNLNYGSEEDFQTLKEAGIVLNGRIGLVKTSDAHLVDKVRRAAEHNISAVLVFTENGLTCTKEVFYDTLNKEDGDPLTSGYAAVDGVWRDQEILSRFPQIPVQTISCDTAHRLLRMLRGQRSPKEWLSKSAFNGTLYMGRKSSHPESWYVTVQTSNYYTNHTIQNIVATINGYQSPGEIVMVGASRTGFEWQGKPSGVERLLGLLQPMATMIVHNRWLPKRTLRFCLWGGQEFGNIGLHEYLQFHRYSVDDTVAYLDLDHSASDQPVAHQTEPWLAVLSSKSLEEFAEAVVAMRSTVLQESLTSDYDNTYTDDDDSDVSSGHFLDPVTQAFVSATFSESSAADHGHVTSYHIPVIRAEIRGTALLSPVDYFKGAKELSRLGALLMLSLADQTVLRYDDATAARMLKLDLWKLTQRSKVLDEPLKKRLHKEADRLVDFTSMFDHILDNRLDYSKQGYVSYINRVLMMLSKQLMIAREQLAHLILQMANPQSDDMEITDDLDLSTEHSPEFHQSVSKFLVTIMSTNSMIQNVNFQIFHYGNTTETFQNEKNIGLDHGWV